MSEHPTRTAETTNDDGTVTYSITVPPEVAARVSQAAAARGEDGGALWLGWCMQMGITAFEKGVATALASEGETKH